MFLFAYSLNNYRSALLVSMLVFVAAILAGCQARPTSDLDVAARQAAIERLADSYRRAYPEVPEVTPAEYLALRAGTGEVVLVDARTAEERAVSMISGAMPKDRFEANRAAYRDDVIVIYCTIGYRSGVYASELRDAGLDARNLRGSILAWLHVGGEVVNEQGASVSKVHVYGKKWDLAPPEYRTVW